MSNHVTVGVVQALRLECERVSEVVRHLDEEGFARPTRCTAWNVKELLAHLYRDVERSVVSLSTVAPAEADTDSIQYWVRYDPTVDSSDIADRAVTRAASYGRGRELALVWDWMWRRALDEAGRTDPDRIVATWGPTMTLEEFLRTRVVEVCVHGLDLADALELPAQPTEEGLAITVEVLEGILGEPAPEALGWDDVAFVEIGTGRRRLSEEESRALGPRAAAFPLLA